MNTKQNGKTTKAQQATPMWFDRFNRVISAAKGKLGSPLTADVAQCGCLIGGAAGKPKRPGVEALFLALTLRPEGCSNADFTTIKVGAGEKTGLSQNPLHYASANLSRAQFGWVHVDHLNGANISRLTAKGAAMCKQAGVPASVVNTLAKPFSGKAPAPVKRKAPAKAPGAPKPAPAPQAPVTAKPTSEAPKPATVPPRQVLTNDGPVPAPGNRS